MNALEMVELTDHAIAIVHKRWLVERRARPPLREPWQMEHRVAITAMRALVAWGEGYCDNEMHLHIAGGEEIAVPRFACPGCMAELKAALEE